MGAATTPTTFLDLYSSTLNRVRNTLGSGTPTTTNSNYAKSYINQANHDLHIQQNWPWAERHDVVITTGPYQTGHVSIASTARTTLEGSGGTTWNTTVPGFATTYLRAGGKLMIGGETEVYVISSVASDTAATLANRYIGHVAIASAYAISNSAYLYYEDEYALTNDFFRLVDLRVFSSELDIPVLPTMEFYRLYPRNASATGKPRVCTVIERGPSGNVLPRPRVVFSPRPDDYYQVPYRYITANLAVAANGTAAVNMSADTDEPIVPLRYRHVLVEYALKIWYRDLRDDTRSQEADAAYVDLVKRMANDTFPQRDHPRLVPRRAPYVLGTAGPHGRFGRSGRGRWTTGTAWDEMRE